jgi:hypothetical protein
MAAGVTIKHKRKAGAFADGDLAVGEIGLDTTNGNIWFSTDGSTVAKLEKRTTIASDAAPAPTGNAHRNFFTVTALATNPTFAAPSGTAADGNQLIIRIKDNGTGRTLAWNAIYRAIGVTLPTTTTANKTIYVGAKYNAADTKWDVIAVGAEA